MTDDVLALERTADGPVIVHPGPGVVGVRHSELSRLSGSDATRLGKRGRVEREGGSLRRQEGAGGDPPWRRLLHQPRLGCHRAEHRVAGRSRHPVGWHLQYRPSEPCPPGGLAGRLRGHRQLGEGPVGDGPPLHRRGDARRGAGGRSLRHMRFEILLTHARVRWLLLRRGMGRTVAEMRRPVRRAPAASPSVQDLAAAVDRGIRLGSRRARPLVKSLVLLRVLARRGIEARLVIGIRPDAGFHRRGLGRVAGGGAPQTSGRAAPYRRRDVRRP